MVVVIQNCSACFSTIIVTELVMVGKLSENNDNYIKFIATQFLNMLVEAAQRDEGVAADVAGAEPRIA